MSNPYPQITFIVKAYNPITLAGQLLPDSRENVISQLESATIWIMNWPYPLKHNDIFTLYGKQAVETLRNYNQLGNTTAYLEVLYYGMPDITYSEGLYGKRYDGFFDDSMSWWNTAVLQGDTSLTTQIDNFSSDSDDYSWMWLGYFYAPVTGNYTFYTTSDDSSYLWVGDNALNGYYVANALVDSGGLHGSQTRSGTVFLYGKSYNPLRLMFGESTGGDFVTLEFEGPGISKTSDGSGYYFGGFELWNKIIG